MKAGEFTLRPFQIEDYDAVLALWQSCDGLGIDDSDTREPIRRYLERNPDLSLVAEDAEQKIIGAVLCGHDGRRGYLHHLAVDKNHRRHGIGLALVEQCLASLKQLGLIKCNITVYGSNAEGLKFWENRKWRLRRDVVMIQKTLTGCGERGC